jgi:hypothetical protein
VGPNEERTIPKALAQMAAVGRMTTLYQSLDTAIAVTEQLKIFVMDAWRVAAGSQSIAEPVSVITAIGDHRVSLLQVGKTVRAPLGALMTLGARVIRANGRAAFMLNPRARYHSVENRIMNSVSPGSNSWTSFGSLASCLKNWLTY